MLVEFLSPVGCEVTGADYTRDLTDNRSQMAVEVRLPEHDPSIERIFGRLDPPSEVVWRTT